MLSVQTMQYATFYAQMYCKINSLTSLFLYGNIVLYCAGHMCRSNESTKLVTVNTISRNLVHGLSLLDYVGFCILISLN